MTALKPIETRYAGRRFRSRLEARWAVFLDKVGIRWEYEPEGYHLPSGGYLPDFLLRDITSYGSRRDMWFEVKPEDWPQRDPRWAELAGLGGRHVLVTFGMPRGDHPAAWPPRDDGMDIFFSPASVPPGWDAVECVGEDSGYRFCRCATCGMVGVEFSGFGGRICMHANDDDSCYGDSATITQAFAAAHSARFEHGEGRAA